MLSSKDLWAAHNIIYYIEGLWVSEYTTAELIFQTT